MKKLTDKERDFLTKHVDDTVTKAIMDGIVASTLREALMRIGSIQILFPNAVEKGTAALK